MMQPYPEVQHRPQSTNVLAVVSLISGIVWLCWIGSIAAVITGHVARKQIRRSGEQGDGLAVAGLVLGYLGALTGVTMIVLMAIGAITAEPPVSSTTP